MPMNLVPSFIAFKNSKFRREFLHNSFRNNPTQEENSHRLDNLMITQFIINFIQ